MASPLRRLVQLVLDRAAAARMEADARKSLGGVEGAIGRLKSAAKALGAAIGGAFIVRSILAFGAAAVREASQADKVWRNLAGTINAAGGSWAALEGDIRSAASALQDVTTFGDEDYADALSNMIAITGNVEASIQNMGLAANVAAQFFDGQLAPATELVAKVSMGMTTQLRRMGIEVETAQEGLDVLAQRSMGAAARQTEGLAGKTKRLSNAWGDFKEALGEAMIESVNGTSIIDTLTGAVKAMSAWVIDNKDELRAWVTGGINIAMTAIRELITLVRTLNQLRGETSLTAGAKAPVLADNAKAVQRQLAAMLTQRKQLERERAAALAALEKAERPGVGKSVLQFLGGPTASVKAIKNVNALGLELQSLNDQIETLDANAAAAQQKLVALAAPPSPNSGNPLGNAPRVIREVPEEDKEAKKEEIDDITASIIRMGEAERVAAGMAALLGDQFDYTGARTSLLETHLEELLAAGLTPLDDRVLRVVDKLAALREEESVLADVSETLANEMTSIGIQSAAFGEGFDSLGAKATALETAITTLAANGFDASNPAMAAYITQLHQIREAMREAEEQAADYGLAVDNLQSLIVGAVGGSLAEVAKAKAKENLLLAAEQAAHGIVSLLNPFTAAKAPGHFASAAKFGAIAAGWAALGAATGGGGASGSGGAALAGGRGASGDAAQGREAPPQEVHIHLDGPGFHALNPEVQRVVYGAHQQARERYGNNAKIAIHRGNR